MVVSTEILPLGLASKAWKAELRDWKLKSIDTRVRSLGAKLLFRGVGSFLIGGLPLPTCFTSWGCLFLNVFCCVFLIAGSIEVFVTNVEAERWSSWIYYYALKKNTPKGRHQKKTKKKSSHAPNISSWGCKDRGFCMISQTELEDVDSSSTQRVPVKPLCRNAPIGTLGSLFRNDTLKLRYYATLGRRKSFSQVPKGIC